MREQQQKLISAPVSTEWYGASALAGIPGMPRTPQGVNALARRAQWASRDRAGRGGGREYMRNTLPDESRAHLAAQIVTANANAGRIEGAKLQLTETIAQQASFNRHLESLKAAVTTPAHGKRRIDAKLALIGLWEQFNKTAGLAVMPSLHKFSELYNAGTIEADADVRQQVPMLCGATLNRWRAAVKRDGVAQLAGRYGNRKGASIIDTQPAVAEFAVSMLVSHPHAGSAHIMQALRARFGADAEVKLPSARALQRWMNAWRQDNRQVHTALTNPDAFKNKFMAAFGSQSSDIERVNQRWELDSTPGDVMLKDGRHAVIGVIDVFTRRARLLVSKTSKGTAIATLLRHTLLDWGVPEVAKTDNGADYVSNHITRVFRDLGVEQELCPPFQPWHKPHIERFFGTFSHDLLELLPNFIGHDVAQRQEIRARKSFADRLLKRGGEIEVSMTAAEFQQFCDSWCNDVYTHRAHGGLNGKSPFEIVSTARDPIRTVADDRALDILLAEAPANNGLRTVQKKGIELDQAYFIAPELGARIGDQVHVRFDPIDLGRVYVFDLDEGFICRAECPERTGMDRKLVASKARAMQIADTQEQRRTLKANARRINTDDVVSEILTDRAAAAGKLAHLPAPKSAHASAGLAAAAAAVQSRRAPAETVSDDAMQKLRDEMAGSTRRKVVAIDDPMVTMRRWEAIAARVKAGAIVSDEDRAWHVAYEGSDEWRAMRRLREDWPDMKRAGEI